MKAAYITGHGGNEVVQIGQREKPSAAPGQVVVRMRAATQENIPHAHAGDICAVLGLRDIVTGDTLSADLDVFLQRPTFPEPVVSLAIEPQTREDQERLGTHYGQVRVYLTPEEKRPRRTKEIVIDGQTMQLEAVREELSARLDEIMPAGRTGMTEDPDEKARLGRSLQGRAALGFDAAGFVQGIVAHPHLEQVAQDEKGVGRGALQVVLPGANGGGLTGLQVQVGNEIDRAPVRRSGKLLEPGHGRGHGDRFQIRGRRPSR